MRWKRPVEDVVTLFAIMLMVALGISLCRTVFVTDSARFSFSCKAERGIASWYGPGFAGKPTASGEVFDPALMTAAHKSLAFGTQVLVVTEDGGWVVVRINDRGPFVEGRIIDLSEAAATALNIKDRGIAPVALIKLAPPKTDAEE